ncbi:DUF309 domain-containing protein [Sporosarcina pasteurii]|uniref:Domain of uncharacterized function (DUF309) n=1 Tax=Sporosarcina pasteurii TaxID=1474 RepID=A0A380BLA0_SPOPA|nr:DUF309 domain-containing protein [Sporosarcina pasteurii]MDS9470784.1 DUF309 domain-containing protein [Sporosarcina pasteurii]QBQ05547.1 DUF309 domain-containing protein [Sporosarcina pasteurii]SUJ02294.1 Domain of uncharacterised function (DUF309) [Sporosarcina pasteurii]
MKPLYHPYFVKFIVYFNKNQDFFECHEVLEEYWNTFPGRTKEHPLTGYILLSTGLYHWRRGNRIGALRTLKKAKDKFNIISERYIDYTEGIDFPSLYSHVKKSIDEIEREQPFASFSISVTSPKLHALVEAEEPLMKLLPLESDAIIHKHILRDRTEIIRLRNEKKKGRR